VLLDLKLFDSGQLRQAASSEGCRSVVAHEGRQVFGLKLRVPGTRLVELQERMFKHDDGTCYCPRHGFVVAERALMALYRTDWELDWSDIRDRRRDAVRDSPPDRHEGERFRLAGEPLADREPLPRAHGCRFSESFPQ